MEDFGWLHGHGAAVGDLVHALDPVTENPNREEWQVNIRRYTNFLSIMTRFPKLPNGRWCQIQELKCHKISEDVDTEMSLRGVFG